MPESVGFGRWVCFFAGLGWLRGMSECVESALMGPVVVAVVADRRRLGSFFPGGRAVKRSGKRKLFG